ncbi:MAG TPA: sigma-70 family RNA polymerase sigma factor [Kribbella sp.]|nr:sigma-70 family RNA polymerase sigma factor [Kribbella sp.]
MKGDAAGTVEDAVVAAVRAGDEATFAEAVERHRNELRVHCYRMLGSFDDAEDLVQETFLRAWRKRADFEGRSSLRAWLYRIATNACIDEARRPQRVLPHQLEPPSYPPELVPARTDLPWLQPYPDRLLDQVAPRDAEPDAAVVRRETIELAFLAAIQHLPARQRAVLIFRDVLGWPAKETAELMDTSVASVNSALQRARPVLREHLPERRSDWAPTTDPTAEEQALLQRYMAAFERSDAAAMAALMHEDVRITMPPYPFWFLGREMAERAFADSFRPESAGHQGHIRLVPAAANLQPTLAGYVRRPGDTIYRAFGVDVFRIENGLVVELTAFETERFDLFGLPPTLP